ncbi:MAG: type II toxin-antitoxin system VapC family toxin [Chloroflexi bacterium]|nr:type II toxin-antitoxin system VapC family toxin [Chloroflexota bacterium]
MSSTSAKPRRLVLDTFALISHLEAGIGSSEVLQLLVEADRGALALHISLISLGELAYIFERRRGPEVAERVLSDVDQLPIEKESVDWQRIRAAASIKARYPISYADAFAAALAHELGCSVVTGDPEFARLEPEVHVIWLGR